MISEGKPHGWLWTAPWCRAAGSLASRFLHHRRLTVGRSFEHALDGTESFIRQAIALTRLPTATRLVCLNCELRLACNQRIERARDVRGRVSQMPQFFVDGEAVEVGGALYLLQEVRDGQCPVRIGGRRCRRVKLWQCFPNDPLGDLRLLAPLATLPAGGITTVLTAGCTMALCGPGGRNAEKAHSSTRRAAD